MRLENSGDVLEFLNLTKELPFSSKHVREVSRISGGFTNYVFRIVLNDSSSCILKHFKSYLVAKKEISMPINRYFIEKMALNVIGEDERLQSERFRLRTPKLIYSNDNEHVLVMEDCGVDSVSLTDYLKLNNQQIGDDIGEKKQVLCDLANEIRSFMARVQELIRPDNYYEPFHNTSQWERDKCSLINECFQLAAKFHVESDLEKLMDRDHELKRPNIDKSFFVHGDFW